MIIPQKHPNEKLRLDYLRSLNILDTLPESDYDNLTQIASQICGTPISLVSLVDDNRQWFKSKFGIEAEETPRDFAFCSHTINENAPIFIVEDATKDVRFHDNPLVVGAPHVTFYAGVPLTDSNDLPIGTLCVIDKEPRHLTQYQKDSLIALAKQVVNLLILRRQNITLTKTLITLQQKNKELENFSTIAAHDLKSPLVGITSVSKLLAESYHSQIDADGQHMLNLLAQSSKKLANMIDSLLTYSRASAINQKKKKDITIDELKEGITALFKCHEKFELTFVTNEVKKLQINPTILNQIIVNLVSNAIKYNDKPITSIEIGIDESAHYYEFYVQDNGPGIMEKDLDKIFMMFETAATQDKYGNQGNGIGLAIVKKLVERNGEKVRVSSKIGTGTKFSFNLKK
ncbi:MAG: GAF domain-containing sensor histidine kinase [Flavobacteriales bacterium]|jgi:signal transduction histidine kinase|nr:GAF domain-containing sensor histidine kinase [Flavobacteriales bacterium]